MNAGTIDEKTAVGLCVGEREPETIRVEAARKLHAAGGLKPFHTDIIAAIIDLADGGEAVTPRSILNVIEALPTFNPAAWGFITSVETNGGNAWTARTAVKAFLSRRDTQAKIDVIKQTLDVSDRGGDPTEYFEKIRDIFSKPIQAETERRTGWTIAELMRESFPEIRFFIERVVTPGLILFWGAPKSGKSVAALQMAVAIGCGGYVFGRLRAAQAGVLYITLEDGGRRLQHRLHGIDAPELVNVRLETAWPSGKKAAPALVRYLDKFPDIQVVIVDPFQQFTAVMDTNDYSETSTVLAELKEIADVRDIAVVVVHHSRKAGKDADGGDWGDSALGSRGMTGKPDTLVHLKRTPGETSDAVLLIRSKDIDHAELALQFDPTTKSWLYIGDASEIPKTPEAQEIIDCLREAGEPMKSGAIAEAIGKELSNVSHQLKGLLKKGMVRKLSYGLWGLNTEGSNTHSNHSNIQTKEDTDPTNIERLNTLNGSTGGSGSKSDTDPDREKWLDEHDGELF